MDKDQRRHRTIISPKKKVAFVCSGGAAKAGAFHLGVALALQEKGFNFIGGLKRPEKEVLTTNLENNKDIRIYVGSSAGSIICAYLASGYTLEQIFNSFLNKKNKDAGAEKDLKRLNYSTMFSLKNDSTSWLELLQPIASALKPSSLTSFVQSLTKGSYNNVFRWKWLKWSGLFSTSGIEKYLREHVLPANDFQSYEADFFVVATQLNHSKKVVFGKYHYSPPDEDKTVLYVNDISVSQACAGSTALPLIFSPFPIKNDKGHVLYYFDGEIRDTLSTHVGFDAGADLIFASYTHQPYHFSREIGSLHEYGMPAIMIQALYLLIERKIQSAFSIQERISGALDATSRFFKEHHLSDDLRKQCLDVLERKLGHKSGVDYIYIHPKSTDYQMFFGDHFNLSAKKLGETVRLGFRCAIDSLRRYEFS